MRSMKRLCRKCVQPIVIRTHSAIAIGEFPPTSAQNDVALDFTHYNKTYANGCTHVSSFNSNTKGRSIVRLSLPRPLVKVPKICKQSNLPNESLVGLQSALVDCKQHPKVMQSSADQLSNHLEKRRFPATSQEIRMARKIVMEDIVENDVQVLSELRNPKSVQFIEKLIYKKAQKILGNMRYNWKPLTVESKEDAAIYALSRFGAYYAEMERVFSEFDRNNYVPETILDYGSGIGATFWAAHTKWGNKIREHCLVDNNYHLRNFCMDIMRGENYNGSGEFVSKNVYFRKNVLPSPKNTYDIVVLHRTLIEMPSHEARMDLINTLWRRANKYLIIVESPMSDSFKAIMQIRDYILTAGHEFDFDYAKDMLDQKGLLDMKTINFLADKRISTYEKLCVVQEKLSDEFKIPTLIEPGFVFAPCPHDQGCPKLSKWLDFISPCKFKVRWTEKRADHRTKSYMRDGTLTGKFSYIIMEKGKRPREVPQPRILTMSEGSKCSTCTICTPSDGLQTFTVSRRSKPIHYRIKASEAGQLLPVDYTNVQSSSNTQFVRELLDDTLQLEDKNESTVEERKCTSDAEPLETSKQIQ